MRALNPPHDHATTAPCSKGSSIFKAGVEMFMADLLLRTEAD